MKKYRCGKIEDVFGFIGWGIQEYRWFGWKTIVIYSDWGQYRKAVNDLREKPNVIVL